MPLAWCAPLSANPPLLGISVAQSRHTCEMVTSAEAFVLNFPTRQLLHHVQYLGSLTGANIDKLEATQLETFESVHVSAPLIEGCAAWVECEVQEVFPIGDHQLFIGLPVAVHVDPRSFDDRWLLGMDEMRPLHFLGGNQYSILNTILEARIPRSDEAPEQALAERIEEELELTQEARERREEMLGKLEREVEQGNLIDISKVALDELPDLILPPQIVTPDDPTEKDDDH